MSGKVLWDVLPQYGGILAAGVSALVAWNQWQSTKEAEKAIGAESRIIEKLSSEIHKQTNKFERSLENQTHEFKANLQTLQSDITTVGVSVQGALNLVAGDMRSIDRRVTRLENFQDKEWLWLFVGRVFTAAAAAADTKTLVSFVHWNF